MNEKLRSDVVFAAPPTGGVGRLFSGTRKPADYPLPPSSNFDCPTGTCDNTACSDIPRNQKRVIEPFSRPHVARNECNRCPTAPPFRLLIAPVPPSLATTVLITDSEGNIWSMDSSLTAPIFHGDGGFFSRKDASATYRIKKVANNQRGGWQCRYFEERLDDTSYDLGTYDYADAPGMLRAVGRYAAGDNIDNLHDDMDVLPHNANPYYAPGLTRTF